MHKALIVVGVIVAFNMFIGIVFLRMSSQCSRKEEQEAKQFEREQQWD